MERGFAPAAHEEIPWKKKNKMKNKRRFTDEQIRLLESIFESDTKLEPRMKLQIARELGLQPRQVAIWFQNRRARWKSKRVEQDYRTLRTDYEKLATRFESLKKEKQSLISQLQKLRELAPEPYDIYKANKGLDGENNKANEGHDGETTKCEPEVEVSPSFQQAPLEFVSVDEYRNESPTSPEKLCGFDSADKIFDHSGSNPQWLNFWIRGEE